MSLAEIERRKEAASIEIFLSLKGMQISLINNVNLEIATIGITDSVPSWSLIQKNKLYLSGLLVKQNAIKVFSQENSIWLDTKYTEYLHATHVVNNDTNNHSSNGENNDFEIQFNKMWLVKPEEGYLKRFWQPGLKVQYRTSTNLMSIKCAIYRLQIDNQLPGKYF